jgi:hypothetical protein
MHEETCSGAWKPKSVIFSWLIGLQVQTRRFCRIIVFMLDALSELEAILLKLNAGPADNRLEPTWCKTPSQWANQQKLSVILAYQVHATNIPSHKIQSQSTHWYPVSVQYLYITSSMIMFATHVNQQFALINQTTIPKSSLHSIHK